MFWKQWWLFKELLIFNININILVVSILISILILGFEKYWYWSWYWFLKNIDIDVYLDIDFSVKKVLISILILKTKIWEILILILFENLILSRVCCTVMLRHTTWYENILLFETLNLITRIAPYISKASVDVTLAHKLKLQLYLVNEFTHSAYIPLK